MVSIRRNTGGTGKEMPPGSFRHPETPGRQTSGVTPPLNKPAMSETYFRSIILRAISLPPLCNTYMYVPLASPEASTLIRT